MAAAIELREGQPSTLDHISAEIDSGFYLDNSFSNRTVATKAFILQLAARAPRSFIGGRPVTLDEVLAEPNRREYHHCYPKAYMARLAADGAEECEHHVNCIANFAFLSRSENRTISDKAPSEYRSLMEGHEDEILASQLIPASLFADDFDAFVVERMKLLTADAARLQGMSEKFPTGDLEPGSSTMDASPPTKRNN